MPRDTWSKWHRIYSVNLILYKSSDLKPLSPLEVLGEFAKNRFGKNFPVAVLLEIWNFGFRMYMGGIISVAKTKALISYAVDLPLCFSRMQ